jgi:drug/metabolite transporter (DMT)-like permease
MAVAHPSVRTSLGYGTGLACVITAGLLWSLMGLGVRMIHEASAFQILFYRSLGVLPCLIGMLAWQSGGHPLRALSRAGVPSILGGLGLVVAFMGSIISLVETSIANATFLFATAPLYSAVLGRVFLGEPVRPATWVAILVATAGVGLMVFEGISGGHLVGNAAALICALGFAGFTIALRWEPGGNAMPATFFGGFYCCIASGLAATIAGQPLLIPVHDAAIAFGLGFLVLSGGLALYTIGSQVVPAAELPLLTLCEVVLGPVWVYLAIGEGAGLLTLIGGTIVLSALSGSALAGLLRERRPRTPRRRRS